jgi:hypothetical protein
VRAEKIRYDVEINWKIAFFWLDAPSWERNRVLILRITPGSSNFLLQDRKFGRTGTGAQVIRCGLLPRAPLSMPAQAHTNP